MCCMRDKVSTRLLDLCEIIEEWLLTCTNSDSASTSATTSASSAATSDATAGFVLTTIDGQRTTLQVAVPTGDATATASNSPTAASTQSTSAPLATGIQSGTASLLDCKAPDGSPVCLPANETLVNTGDTYFGKT